MKMTLFILYFSGLMGSLHAFVFLILDLCSLIVYYFAIYLVKDVDGGSLDCFKFYIVHAQINGYFGIYMVYAKY